MKKYIKYAVCALVIIAVIICIVAGAKPKGNDVDNTPSAPTKDAKPAEELVEKAEKANYTIETTKEIDLGDDYGKIQQSLVSATNTECLAVITTFKSKEQLEKYTLDTVTAYADANKLPDAEKSLRENGCFAGVANGKYYIVSIKDLTTAYSMTDDSEKSIKEANTHFQKLGYKVPDTITQPEESQTDQEEAPETETPGTE